MKNVILALHATVILSTTLTGQTPGFNYQAVLRDVQGQPMAEVQMSLHVSLTDGPQGELLYEEGHEIITNELGLINLVIGQGSAESGIYENITGVRDLHIRLHAQLEGSAEITDLGEGPIGAVPLALYGRDEDSDPQNELQSLMLDGDSLMITKGKGIGLKDLNIPVSGQPFIILNETGDTTHVLNPNGVGAAIEVNHLGDSGNIAVFQNDFVNQAKIDRAGTGFFNGGTQLKGVDIAEEFHYEGSFTLYEPGDVLAISLNEDKKAVLSSEAYSTLVIGVYSTKPGVLLTERHVDDNPILTGLYPIPLGLLGVIPTKVSGENGPIKRGDMLVAASTPGHAMKGTDRDRMLGAIIGKALQEFNEEGTGVIEVLVNVK